MIKLSSFDVELKFKFKYAHIVSVIDRPTQSEVSRERERLLTTGGKHCGYTADPKVGTVLNVVHVTCHCTVLTRRPPPADAGVLEMK